MYREQQRTDFHTKEEIEEWIHINNLDKDCDLCRIFREAKEYRKKRNEKNEYGS